MGNRQVKLTAVLKDSGGNPLSGKSITFEYKASTATTWTNAGSANTDANGTASVTVTVAVPGTYDFRAKFQGDNQYEASEATVTNYAVKDKTTITLTIAPQ
jgi:5-hydroxyisourate hydrolase-like protein (transthyretin family)